MTREEAICRLKNTAWLGSNEEREETEQAVGMAIEALTHEIRTETHGVCSDLISREAVKAEATSFFGHSVVFENRIDKIPSAEVVPIHNDGTLEVKVPNAQKVGRVLVIDTDSHIGGGLFYPDGSVQGWIPVGERLPSDEGCYLVCMSWEHNNMDVLTWADGWNCYRGYGGEICKENEIDGADILAWMPLPKPYKGGDDE